MANGVAEEVYHDLQLPEMRAKGDAVSRVGGQHKGCVL